MSENDWISSWSEGRMQLEEWEEDALKKRPEVLHDLMIKFPPSSVVSTERDPRKTIVTTYVLGSDEDKCVIYVRYGPDATVLFLRHPNELILEGYHRDMTRERMKKILQKE